MVLARAEMHSGLSPSFNIGEYDMEKQNSAVPSQTNMEYLTVKSFVSRFPYIPEPTIRWQIYRSKQLGLSSAFLRPFGQRKILINVDEYFRLMLEKHEEASGSNG